MARLTAPCAAMIGLASLPALAQAPVASGSRPAYGAWGIDTGGMDRTVRPGDDFAMYAFGEWYRNTSIPEGEPAVWWRMHIARVNRERLLSVVQRSANNPANANQRLIADLYNSYMDTAQIEKLDGAPLRADLDSVRRLAGREAVAEAMGRTHGAFGLAFFEPIMMPDVRNPERYIPRLQQSGLGAGSRDPYLSERMKGAREAYQGHAARMLELAGWAEPARHAREIVALETRIAEASWGLTESEDLTRITNYMSVAELERFAPGFPWRAYLAGAGMSSVTNVVVAQKSAFPKIAAIFGGTPLETLKAWVAFHKTDRAAPFLSSRFERAHFAFWGRMEGREAPRPRAQSAAMLADATLSHPVGREFVAAYFPAEAKTKLKEMVGHIRKAMAARIRRLDWMSEPTRSEALAKLKGLGVGIGYPDRWRDYSGLTLAPGDLYGNIRRANAFNWAWQVGKLGRRVDREEWTMPAQAEGAQASYFRNYLTFSAGYLHPPMFDPRADPAVNYGAIGYVIGHEIGHVFDSEGAKIDSRGRMRDWWAPADAKRFEAKTEQFVRQLGAYDLFPGEKVNGRAALRETMANLTGVEAALDGYHASLGGRRAPILDGFTGDQRFFLSFAQTLKGKAGEEFQRQNHEQAPFIPTIHIVVRNVDRWYDAFGVQPRDKLYLKPEDRIRAW